MNKNIVAAVVVGVVVVLVGVLLYKATAPKLGVSGQVQNSATSPIATPPGSLSAQTSGTISNAAVPGEVKSVVGAPIAPSVPGTFPTTRQPGTDGNIPPVAKPLIPPPVAPVAKTLATSTAPSPVSSHSSTTKSR